MVFFRSKELVFRCFFALGAAAVPVLLGGGADPRVMAFAGLAVGAAWLVSPPPLQLDRFWFIIFLLLALLPLLVLLPLGAWSHDVWRARMEGILPAAPLLTPQPLVFCATLPAYYGGLALAAWLLRAGWKDREKEMVSSGLGFLGICVLVLAAMRYCTGWELPWWEPVSGTGPFSSRNQTGLFFALGLIWNLVLAGRCWKQRKWPLALFWLASCGGFALAVAVNGSRAGIGFAGLGVVLYFAVAALHRPALLALAMGLALAALLGLSILRLDPALRFQEIFRPDAVSRSFRLKVQEDTFDMIRDAPLTGVGLGNYDAAFPFYRTKSANEYRVLHAESDWLHFAAEGGLPALLVVAAALFRLFVLSGRNVLGDRSGYALPAGIGMLFAVLHGFADQSLHTPGFLYPVLVMASLALPASELRTGRTRPAIFWRSRVLGAGLIALAGFSLWRLEGAVLRRAVAEGTDFRPRPEQTLEILDRALARAPLAWNLRELRGHVLLQAGRKDEALAEFRAARVLDPQSVLVPHREANAWFDAGEPKNGAEAAKRAVLRAPPATRVAIYEHYLNRASSYAGAKKELMDLEPASSDLEAARLAFYSPTEAGARLDALLASRPAFSKLGGDRVILFAARNYGVGGREKISRSGARIGDASWRSAAKKLAAEQRLREACDIVIRQLPPWTPPAGSPDLGTLRKDFLAAPNDLSRGLQLADAYLRAGNIFSAERTLGPFRNSQASLPALGYYVGWSDCLKGDLPAAWSHLQNYLDRMPQRPYAEEQ